MFEYTATLALSFKSRRGAIRKKMCVARDIRAISPPWVAFVCEIFALGILSSRANIVFSERARARDPFAQVKRGAILPQMVHGDLAR